MRLSIRARFEQKIMTIPECGCWIWMGSTNSKGYPNFWHKGHSRHGNRVAWELYRGIIPAGLHVLHSCDTPSCVNPNHLFLGTNQENKNDSVKKSRHRWTAKYGDDNAQSKLTSQEVLRILSSGDPGYLLAKRFNISQQTICDIKKGRRWKYLTSSKEIADGN